jgi:hypothetical protein
MTPDELNLMAEVHKNRTEQRFEENVTYAWMAEYYHRLEKLPSLKEALEELKPKKPMTDDEMKEMALRLNAMFGGTVKKEGN